MASAKILEFIASESGIAQNPSQFEAVENFHKPTTMTELISFLGLCSFYRMFMSDFSKITDTLTVLYSGPEVEKADEILWTTEATTAFEELTEKRNTALVLSFFDENALQHSIHVDASNNSCEGVSLRREKKETK